MPKKTKTIDIINSALTALGQSPDRADGGLLTMGVDLAAPNGDRTAFTMCDTVMTATEVQNRVNEMYGTSPIRQATEAMQSINQTMNVEMLERARRMMTENNNLTADDLLGRFDMNAAIEQMVNPSLLVDEAQRSNIRMRHGTTRLDNRLVSRFDNTMMNFRATQFTPRTMRDEMEAFDNLFGRSTANTTPDGMFEARLFELLERIVPTYEWELQTSPLDYNTIIRITATFSGDLDDAGQRRRIDWNGVVLPEVIAETRGLDLARQQEIGQRYIRTASPIICAEFVSQKRNEFVAKYNEHLAAKKPHKKTPRSMFLKQAVFSYIDDYYIREQRAQMVNQYRDRFNRIHDDVFAMPEVAMQRYEEKPTSPETATWLSETKVPDYIEANVSDKPYKAFLLDDTMKLWKESHEMGNCLYRSYTNRVMKKDYIAYHIRANHLSKSGYTVGFSRQSETEWRFDQMKCKRNSMEPDQYLKMFADHLLKEVNKNYGRETERTEIQPELQRVDS